MSTPAGSPALFCQPGNKFELPPGYDASDFLYGDHGPWPSLPRVGNPCAIAPEVYADPDDDRHRIPDEELEAWQECVGDYLEGNFPCFAWNAVAYCAKLLGVSYDHSDKIEILSELLAWQFSGKRPAFRKEVEREGKYPALSDGLFTDLIAHGLLSKLMSALDISDKTLFHKFLDSERHFWKSDLTHMRVLRTPLNGETVAPCVVLMSRPKSHTGAQEFDFRVDAIALFYQSQTSGPYDKYVVLAPGDGKSWQLAKYFALQAAVIRLNLIDHTMVHFPFDAINAITKSTLPTSNPILQLLQPHLFLSLPVDNAVLEGNYSLLNRTKSYPYSPYPAVGEEMRQLFPFYWVGSQFEIDAAESWALDRDTAFPSYKFETKPREIPSKYGRFLNNYHEPILEFAKAVVSTITPEDRKTVSFWANHVRSWIPGFPDHDQIQKGDVLAEVCAMIIWNCSIVHTADHWLMHEMFETGLPTPYIMRDAPPQKASPGVDPDYRATVKLLDDLVPARLCDLMFFRPHNSTLLSEFKYGFNPPLGPQVEAFRNALRTVDTENHLQFPEFRIHLNPSDLTDGDSNCFAAGVQF